jgi:hypothetical protein
MLTGERWMLDNLQAQASACIMGAWPAPRENGKGLVMNGGQVRGSAWNMRQLENAAWLSPDGSAEQAYFSKIAENNWDWLIAKIPEWTARQGETHGYVPGHYREPGAIAPWQQDFFAGVVALVASRGNDKAKTVLAWMSNFLLGRFENAHNEVKLHLGAAYTMATGDMKDRNVVYSTWAEIGRESEARGLARGNWGSGQYFQLALASIAGIATTLQSERAALAFVVLAQRTPGGPTVANYRRDPTYNIVPPGVSRAGASDHRCTPSRSPG